MTIDKGIVIRNIYYMLTYAFGELRRNNYDEIAGEDFENILDLFAEIMYRGISYQLKRGLHKDYIARADAMTTVRGRIDMCRSLRLRPRMVMECEYDEFSEDNVHNRILRSTLHLLLTSEDVRPRRKHKLRSLLPFFSGVGECRLHDVNWGSLRYDRNSSTYHMLHNFSYFIVRRMLLTTDSGPFRSPIFDDEVMSRLFERFVLNYYRRHYPQYAARSAKVEWNIVAAESTGSLIPEMQTDIMLELPGRKLIIDTKYYSTAMQEHMGKIAIRNSNLYQINAYVQHEDKTHSGKVNGMLLYAKTGESVSPDGQMKLLDGNIIYFRNLDLSRDFGYIKHALDGYVRLSD